MVETSVAGWTSGEFAESRPQGGRARRRRDHQNALRDHLGRRARRQGDRSTIVSAARDRAVAWRRRGVGYRRHHQSSPPGRASTAPGSVRRRHPPRRPSARLVHGGPQRLREPGQRIGGANEGTGPNGRHRSPRWSPPPREPAGRVDHVGVTDALRNGRGPPAPARRIPSHLRRRPGLASTTRTPSRLHCAPTSRSNVDFPMPSGPRTSTSRPCSPAARKTASRVACSSERPGTPVEVAPFRSFHTRCPLVVGSTRWRRPGAPSALVPTSRNFAVTDQRIPDLIGSPG